MKYKHRHKTNIKHRHGVKVPNTKRIWFLEDRIDNRHQLVDWKNSWIQTTRHQEILSPSVWNDGWVCLKL
jgi:hypothetical protein